MRPPAPSPDSTSREGARPSLDSLAERCAVALRRHRGPIPEDLRGGCQVGSVLLSLALQHYRYRHRFEDTPPYRHGDGHAWIDVRGRVLDITASQFGFPGFVHNRRPKARGWRSHTPGRIGRFYRSAMGRDFALWWVCAPRRRFDVLVPALAEVLSIGRREARRRVVAFIGPEVQR